MGVFCAVRGCLSNSKDNPNQRRFYRFPQDETRCLLWIRKIGRTDLESKDLSTLHKSYRICDLHFLSTDRYNRYLNINAIPSLLLDLQHENSYISSKYTQTEDAELKCRTCYVDKNTPSTSDTNIAQTVQTNVFATKTVQDLPADSQRKRKLNDQLTSECKMQKTTKQQLQKSEDLVVKSNKPELLSIVEKILKIKKKMSHVYESNRYDLEYKMFAMNIYFASPLAYRILAKTLFLPSEQNFKSANIDIGTDFSEHAIRCLQSKVNNLSDSEKICVMCADKMTLRSNLIYQVKKDKIIGFHEINGVQKKEPATKALVVMVRGLFSKWKQPLAYCFLNHTRYHHELNNWLDNIIMKVMNIGLKVVAFTSDLGSNFISMAKNRNVTAAYPFFRVNGKKIYYIFDVPHLLKCLRNNLIENDFVIWNDTDGKEEIASWADIQNLYCIEKDKSYQMAFKLTESHIRPNNFEKTNIKFAAQVFSRSVANAMQCCVDLGKLPENAKGTAKFIQLTNDMFDILNSSSCNETYKYKNSFSRQAYQIEVLQKVLQYAKNLQKSNGTKYTNIVKCLKSLEITIQSVIQLSIDLERQDFKFLFTQRLNQDILENLFSAIRQQEGNCREPSPIQFASAFRKLFITNIISITHAKYAHYEQDLDKLLIAVEDNSNPKLNDLPEKEEDSDLLTVGTVDYRFELPEGNAFSYVCDYLLKKCKEVHENCTLMDEYVNASIQQENFKDYVRQMDEIVTTIFKREDLPPHIGNKILKNISIIMLKNQPCECFPIAYLQKLFVRFRLFDIIRHNNRHFKDPSVIDKFFSISLLEHSNDIC